MFRVEPSFHPMPATAGLVAQKVGYELSVTSSHLTIRWLLDSEGLQAALGRSWHERVMGRILGAPPAGCTLCGGEC